MNRLQRSPQLFKSLINNRQLLWRLSEREVIGRYRGSLLGWAWTILNPLLMLAVYTFVFSTVFNARWPSAQAQGHSGFALNLFAGLIVFNLIAECIGKAPILILSSPNYVKKVVFPLELLGASAVASAVFHACTSVVVLIVFQILANGYVPVTLIFLPMVWLPLVLGCLGTCLCLSALGVYLRDLPQLVNVFLSILMYLSAIFYPLSALPEKWQPFLGANPIAIVIEQTRTVLINGSFPSTLYLCIGIPAAVIWCEISYAAFQRARRGFADVI